MHFCQWHFDNSSCLLTPLPPLGVGVNLIITWHYPHCWLWEEFKNFKKTELHWHKVIKNIFCVPASANDQGPVTPAFKVAKICFLQLGCGGKLNLCEGFMFSLTLVNFNMNLHQGSSLDSVVLWNRESEMKEPIMAYYPLYLISSVRAPQRRSGLQTVIRQKSVAQI